ncbi:MAG: hypothetical protein ACKPKO_63950, partial [Candidatus Fonsibacter sp.]
MISGGSLWIGGLTPTIARPVLEATDVQQWLTRLQEPVRLNVEPGVPGRDDTTWVRLTAAAKGHDLQWLIDTGGDLPADDVAREIGRVVSAPVTAAPVNAMDLDSGSFSDMVLVRVTAGQIGAMNALMTTGNGVYIRGRQCKVFPLTTVRTGAAVQ